MKKSLIKSTSSIYHMIDGQRVDGPPSNILGDVSGIEGKLDDCEITDEERVKGLNIKELLK